MKKIFLVVFLAIVMVSCKKDDDGSNNNCDTPAVITVVQLNSTSLLFEWDTSTGTAWQIEYGPTGFQLGTGTVAQTSQFNYLIENLTPSTSYTIYLRNNCGSDGFSDYITLDFITLDPVITCNIPLDLTQIGLGSNYIDITWNENNETAWEVEYGLVGHPIGSGTVEPTSQNSYRIDGLTPATTYEIYVRANCGSDGFSEYTDALVITTNN